MPDRETPQSPERRPAEGHVHRNRLRIVCDLDPEEFDRIAAADIPGCPRGVMAPKIRTLIEWGLEALERDAK